MKKSSVLIGGILILSISGFASAGQDSGFYLGGSFGSAALDVSRDTITFDDNDLAYKVLAGFNFGVIPLIDLGIEGSYVDFGEASSREIMNDNVGITGWDLFGVGALNLGPIGVFGKVGRIWWNSDSNYLQGILDDSGNDMGYGIGVRFQAGSLALRAEYEIFETSVADMGYASAGICWTF